MQHNHSNAQAPVPEKPTGRTCGIPPHPDDPRIPSGLVCELAKNHPGPHCAILKRNDKHQAISIRHY